MLSDQLWGGILEGLAFDVSAQTVCLSLKLIDGGESERHELRLSDVGEFHFVNAIPGPWAYAEVTELHFEQDASTGAWQFDIMLWSEDAGITGRCRAVAVDGVDLAADRDPTKG